MKRICIAVCVAVLMSFAVARAQEKPAEPKKRATHPAANTSSCASRSGAYSRLSLIRGMAPLEDGGVAVMVADKLVKYDKDLNKVKEVTIDIPQTAAQPSSGNCGSSKAGCTSCAEKPTDKKAKE